jgi:hypothetical protein
MWLVKNPAAACKSPPWLYYAVTTLSMFHFICLVYQKIRLVKIPTAPKLVLSQFEILTFLPTFF